MKKIFFAMSLVGLCAASANAAVAPVPPNVVDGCYRIGTVGELYGFAAVVNGTNGQTANKTACGKLTADITVNDRIHETATNANAELFANNWSGNYTITSKFNEWTPIEGFAGTFDGNGKTINGLFYLAESEAGFFKSVYGGAVIKNVKIADSYFRVNSATAGGLIAKVVVSGNTAYDGKLVLVDNCTFGAPANHDDEYVRGTVAGGIAITRVPVVGTVTKSSGGTNIGGLVGVVSSGTKIVISNSVNAGRVLSSYPDKNDFFGVSMTTYAAEETVAGTNIGGLIAYVEPGAVASVANSYNTGKVDAKSGSTGLSATVGSAAGSLQTDNVACASGMSSCTNGKSSSELTSAFSSYNQASLFAFYDVATVESIIGEDSHPGVVFSEENNGLVATITDASETFSIPQDIKVSKVVFNRVLKNNTSSTMALPFDIATGKLSGAAFYEPTAIVARANDDDRDTINVQPVNDVVAYKSYVVIPDAEGSLVVDGAVVLKKTSGADLNNDFSADWQFINPIEMKRWDVVGSTKYPEGNNADEIGRVYGFAGVNTTGAELGSFVRVATNVAIKPMRGYLKYTGELPEGCKNALCKAATTVQMPESFVLRIVEPVVPSDEDQVTLEEGTTALQGMRQVPMAKTDRWFDLKGRSLNKKPANKGVFINNRKPVIVK